MDFKYLLVTVVTFFISIAPIFGQSNQSISSLCGQTEAKQFKNKIDNIAQARLADLRNQQLRYSHHDWSDTCGTVHLEKGRTSDDLSGKLSDPVPNPTEIQVWAVDNLLCHLLDVERPLSWDDMSELSLKTYINVYETYLDICDEVDSEWFYDTAEKAMASDRINMEWNEYIERDRNAILEQARRQKIAPDDYVALQMAFPDSPYVKLKLAEMQAHRDYTQTKGALLRFLVAHYKHNVK